ncbi:MAG TPA: N-acetylglucosamine-6-phosphate deacetylase [Candidatus Krumholzibacteriaceae bacterium]|nr:N-acetylglucosamine-6-phosphate deacetylase [Candidatus Krumholzibacteriaceae bacterium]
MSGYTLRGTVVTPFELISHGQVEIAGGRVLYAGPRRHPHGEVFDHGDDLICPGLVDIHVHGGAGYDAMDDAPEAMNGISGYLAAGGVTAFLATTQTTSRKDLLESVKRIVEAAETGLGGARLLGLHLEGPYLSEERRGAQHVDAIRAPDTEELRELHAAAGGLLRIVTLAPEAPGALGAITWLTDHGIVASAGHTDADYDTALAAFGHGLSHVSHLYNGMRGLHHREPGIIGAALTDGRVSVELIADGLHVHPAALRLAALCKSPVKTVLVSDSIKPAGLPDGEYTYGGRRMMLRDGIVRLPDGVIAGSSIRLNDAVRVMVEEAGFSVSEAVQMASNTPARVLRLTPGKGRLAEGSDADVTIMDWRFNVKETIVGGDTVYRSDT